MRIGILTSFRESCTEEDYILAKSFAEDGHKVDMIDFPIPFDFENIYDAIILKNAWLLDEKDYHRYFEELGNFLQKILSSKCKLISSVDGKLDFNNSGKKYLVELFKKGYNVVPTIDNIDDFHLLPKTEKYIKKPYVSYDGFDQVSLTREEALKINLKDEVLQPKLKFISEVQMYFVNDEYQYSLEYTPSKWPNYPKPHVFNPSQKYIDECKEIIRLNGASCTFNRLDFLRLDEENMIMLEFADTNPNMSLPLLDEETRSKFLANFKKAVYEYIKK